MEIIFYIGVVLEIIGGATILLRGIAPLTKTKWDNYALEILTKFLKKVSLNLEESKIEIKVDKKV